MKIDEKKLLKLKETITESKEQLASLKGEYQGGIKRLKEEFGCESIEDAKQKVIDLDKEITKLETSIEEGLETLETEFGIKV